MDTIQNKTQKSTIKTSIEDKEIENLDKKRKELKTKNKQKTKRQSRICRTQQNSGKRNLEQEHGGKKRINTGNTRSKKWSKTDQ